MIDKTEQEIILKNRTNLRITAISSIKDFTPLELVLECNEGLIIISGNDLRIEELSRENGIVNICGTIDAIEYKTSLGKKKFLQGLFK